MSPSEHGNDGVEENEPVFHRLTVRAGIGNPNIVWAGPSVDITPKVIQRLDAAIKKSLQ